MELDYITLSRFPVAKRFVKALRIGFS